MTAEEFYRLRDNRTLRTGVDPAYQQKTCLIMSGPRTVNSFAGQVMVLGTLNLLSRWCRSVDLLIPDAPLHDALRLASLRTVHERAVAEMHSADPFGEFSTVDRPRSHYDLAMAIGEPRDEYPADFTIQGNGWDLFTHAGSHEFHLVTNSPNPCGPMGAACIGVAQLFKKATGQDSRLMVSSVGLSLFDLSLEATGSDASTPEIPDILDLGRTLMVGAGMIGSSALYVLRMMRLRGTLGIVDHDSVKIENLNRSTVYGLEMCGQPKAEAATEYVSGPDLEVRPFVAMYSEYIRTNGRSPNSIDLLLPLANEFGVRTTIENNYPPLMVYATTTRDWGTNFGRHIPLREDCLLCRYPPEPVDPALVCGEGTFVVPGVEAPVDVALPFTPSFGAVLLIAELIKLQLEGYPFNENFAFFDLKGPLKVIDHSKRIRSATCACGRRHRSVFTKLNGKTRYAALSLAPEGNSRPGGA